jgi:phosphate transport system permease protein
MTTLDRPAASTVAITTGPTAADDPSFDRPRAVGRARIEDRGVLVGAASASLALTWLGFGQLFPMRGLVGFVVVWWLAFVVVYAGLTALTESRAVVTDRIVTAMLWTGALVLGTALTSMVVYTFVQGVHAISHANFFTQDMSGVGPTASLDRGGILHVLVGSLVEISIAVVVTVPLGIGTAVFMSEVGGPFSQIVRTVVEAMTALPSIVAGLFIYTVLIVELHVERTGFAAAMAISVMMLPIIARAAYVVLQVAPGGLREASLALGVSRWRTVRSVVLPTVRPGLATAVILGVARGVGETSPVLLTSGASTYFNANPVVDPMNSLPLFVFSAVRSGEPVFIERGFGAATVLLTVVLVLFAATRFLARQRGGAR